MTHIQRRAGGHICLQLACHGNEVPKASGALCGGRERSKERGREGGRERGRAQHGTDSLHQCQMGSLLWSTQTDDQPFNIPSVDMTSIYKNVCINYCVYFGSSLNIYDGLFTVTAPTFPRTPGN